MKHRKMGRLSAFPKKEVVNLADGRRLGFLCDAEVNLDTGRVEAIVVSVTGKISVGAAKFQELIIPFEKIKKIGEDIVLVHVEERYLKQYFT